MEINRLFTTILNILGLGFTCTYTMNHFRRVLLARRELIEYTLQCQLGAKYCLRRRFSECERARCESVVGILTNPLLSASMLTTSTKAAGRGALQLTETLAGFSRGSMDSAVIRFSFDVVF